MARALLFCLIAAYFMFNLLADATEFQVHYPATPQNQLGVAHEDVKSNCSLIVIIIN
jgi:hypothetical protein